MHRTRRFLHRFPLTSTAVESIATTGDSGNYKASEPTWTVGGRGVFKPLVSMGWAVTHPPRNLRGSAHLALNILRNRRVFVLENQSLVK